MLDLRSARDRDHHRRAVEQPPKLVRRLAQALAKRAPRNEGDTLGLTGLEHVLGGEKAAVVLVLHRRDLRHGLRLTQLLEREVRDADQPDLPLLTELLERADRLLDRDLRIVW